MERERERERDVYVYAYIHIYIYIYMYIYVYTHTCTWKCVNLGKCLVSCSKMHLCSCAKNRGMPLVWRALASGSQGCRFLLVFACDSRQSICPDGL